MLITAEEYKSMGFPEVSGADLDSCILRSDYIIGALTEGRAARAVQNGGQPAQFVKQAAGFQTYLLMREEEEYSGSVERSGTERVSLGDYSYTSESRESSSSQSPDCAETGLNVIRLLRASGCLFAGVEVLE